jgi:hypothetical protein
MLFENLANLPLGIRRILFSSLNGKSWVQVGTLRRERHGIVVEFQGEFEACRPIWEAISTQIQSNSTAPDDDLVAFAVLWDNHICPVARGVLTRNVAYVANAVLRQVRTESRARLWGGPASWR